MLRSWFGIAGGVEFFFTVFAFGIWIFWRFSVSIIVKKEEEEEEKNLGRMN